MENLYIQYGAGWDAPPGWLNFDSSPTLRFERIPLIGMLYTKNQSRFPENVVYGDIAKGLPIPLGSARGIYCSHILEHLSLEDLRLALRNTYHLLNDGGIFRLVMPDLAYLVKNYLIDQSTNPASSFLINSGLGRQCRPKGFISSIINVYGNSEHLWLWDEKSISNELSSAGFRSIRRAVFNDSEDRKFIEVENPDRWTNCLGIECVK